MNKVIELIEDEIELLRRKGHGDDIQFYVAVGLYRENIMSERRLSGSVSEYQKQEDMTAMAGGKADEKFGHAGYSTHEIVGLHGATIIEDPSLPEGHISMVDASAMVSNSQGNAPMLRDGIAVNRWRLAEPDNRESCSKCGEDEGFIEGDEGELYCSINCLNKAYQ